MISEQQSVFRGPGAQWAILGGLAMSLGGMLAGEWFALVVSYDVNGRLAALWRAAIAESGRGGAAIDFAAVADLAAFRGQALALHAHLPLLGLLVMTAGLIGAQRMPRGVSGWAAAALLAGACLASGAMMLAGPAAAATGGAGLLLLLAGLTATVALPARQPEPWPRPDPVLRTAGLALIAAGLVIGLAIAGFHLLVDRPAEAAALRQVVGFAHAGEPDKAQAALIAYRTIRTRIAIDAAGHSHAVALGILTLLIAFILPAARLGRRTRRFVRGGVIGGSVALPLCVLSAVHIARGFAYAADIAGAIVAIGCVPLLVARYAPAPAPTGRPRPIMTRLSGAMIVAALVASALWAYAGHPIPRLVAQEAKLTPLAPDARAASAALAQRTAGATATEALVQAHGHLLNILILALAAALVMPSSRASAACLRAICAGALLYPAGLLFAACGQPAPGHILAALGAAAVLLPVLRLLIAAVADFARKDHA